MSPIQSSRSILGERELEGKYGYHALRSSLNAILNTKCNINKMLNSKKINVTFYSYNPANSIGRFYCLRRKYSRKGESNTQVMLGFYCMEYTTLLVNAGDMSALDVIIFYIRFISIQHYLSKSRGVAHASLRMVYEKNRRK
ncbi:hypothetical protein [Ammoniphilus sp. 3BR4]|uniref:hypothetical protein n=1 Tax=Ammoniphilus sp. 3BR4 TaxID=3158265 RepID=UPI003466C91C